MKGFGLVLLLALGSCAAPVPPTARMTADGAPLQCFQRSSISSYQAVDEEAVLVRVGASEVWRLGFEGSCPKIGFAFGRIGVEQRVGGQICQGGDAEVVFNDQGITRRCLVGEVRRLNSVEIAALPAGQRP